MFLAKTGCHLCQAWSHLMGATMQLRQKPLSKRYKTHCGQLMPVSSLSSFERFWQSLQCEPRQVAPVKELLEEAWARLRVGWCRVSGNHEVGVTCVSQGNGEHRISALLTQWEDPSAKDQWCPPASDSKERAAPPALALKIVNLVPPCMCLVLLSCCPCTGVHTE